MRGRFWNLERFWIYGFDTTRWRALAYSAAGLAILGFGILISYNLLERNKPAPTASITSPAPAPNTQLPVAAASPAAQLSQTPPIARQASTERSAAPLTLIPRRSRAGYSAELDGPPIVAEPVDSEYVGLPVSAPGEGQSIMLLPKKLRVQYGPPSEEYFIRNVSH
jgi:hypothetical protein